MISCKNRRLIGPYLDGQLGECRWLDEHICECSECLAEYESIQRFKYLVRQLDFSPPESFYWKNFPSRVSARIATRQSQRFLARSRLMGLGKKFVLRILTPLMIAVVAVFVLRMIYHENRYPEKPLSIHVGDKVISPDDYLDVSVGSADELISSGDIPDDALQQSESLPVIDMLPIKPNDESSRAIVIADKFSVDFEYGLDSIALKILNDDYRQIGLKRDNLVGMDFNLIDNYGLNRLTSFSSDCLIRYQILAGFNSSVIPISSYKKEASKFFAPKTSLYSNVYNQKVSSSWGLASGGEKYDLEKLRRLMLELDLSREK